MRKKNALHGPSLIPLIAGALFAVAGLYLILLGTPAPEYASIAWDGLLNDAIPLYVIVVFGVAIFNLVYVYSGSKAYDREQVALYNVAGMALALIILVALGM